MVIEFEQALTQTDYARYQIVVEDELVGYLNCNQHEMPVVEIHDDHGFGPELDAETVLQAFEPVRRQIDWDNLPSHIAYSSHPMP